MALWAKREEERRPPSLWIFFFNKNKIKIKKNTKNFKIFHWKPGPRGGTPPASRPLQKKKKQNKASPSPAPHRQRGWRRYSRAKGMQLPLSWVTPPPPISDGGGIRAYSRERGPVKAVRQPPPRLWIFFFSPCERSRKTKNKTVGGGGQPAAFAARRPPPPPAGP
nr:hypothetical protein [Morchella crassipes]